MRLAICTLSAVLLSGCSWLGHGGGYSADGYGAGGAYDCQPTVDAWGAQGAYGQVSQSSQAGCYGVGGQAAMYGGQGFGAQGQFAQGQFGQGQFGQAQFAQGQAIQGQFGQGQFGQAGAGGQYAPYGAAALGGNGGPVYGVNGYQGAYGQVGGGQVTTLGADAAYGSAVFGQNVVGSQYVNGQFASGAVQTVQGAPIYVPQPYGVPVGQPVLRGATAALPWAFTALGGTEFDIDGDLVDAKPAGPAFTGDPAVAPTSEAGASGAISYDDAFENAYKIGGGLEYDVSRSTTLLGHVAYATADGNTIDNFTTTTPGTYDAAGNFTATGATRALNASFDDLDTYTFEGGVRQYLGHNYAFRPYVAAKGGAIYNQNVDFVQTFADDGTVFGEVDNFIDSGWNPTAAGLVGAEFALGKRGAIGVESGIRWTDGLDTVLGDGDSRFTVPVNLRGRIAF